jgi:hypothetical protein
VYFNEHAEKEGESHPLFGYIHVLIFLFSQYFLLIVYIYIMLYQVSSNKEPAMEVEDSSLHDANVAHANAQAKQKQKLAKERKAKSPWRTSV